MRNEPSSDPRDQAIRAALRDGSTIASMVASEFVSTYHGPERALYEARLEAYVVDLGGRLDPAVGRDLVAEFGGRRIRVRMTR